MAERDDSTGTSTEKLDEERFRKYVQRRRQEKGWSQGELARRMRDEHWEDFHQTTISRIEKGQRSVRLGEARTLARLFGTTIESMISQSEEGQLVDEFWQCYMNLEGCRADAKVGLMKFLEEGQRMTALLARLETVDISTVLPDHERRSFSISMTSARTILSYGVEGIVQRAEDEADIERPIEAKVLNGT